MNRQLLVNYLCKQYNVLELAQLQLILPKGFALELVKEAYNKTIIFEATHMK